MTKKLLKSKKKSQNSPKKSNQNLLLKPLPPLNTSPPQYNQR